ncbi:recombinase family protein [Listeria monocytogenes]|uniref:recombinase family protein n=1 Tax=Listeria monocytogenes TaxID=1639 RepID=UPI000FC280F1|nr:recombinase family protein [Listeria monocytogenes]EAC4040239.1 recombinase family protein [Listeria monocytogenes]EAD4645563.1 recombinase family protein [Listeria monocytogenes]EAF3291286.1 recombinase family protein [Listeria monocytogenes]EAG7889016.1 recombinase family protein [Listeria monocytogenes]EAH2959311.1 recombinase family protein [Listeria monocytogenes]
MRKITTLDVATSSAVKPKQKVAAYIRVSTSNEDQLISLEAQRRHYKTLIETNEEWQLVDIYSDEGITGTKKDRRPELLRLMSDCEKGKIDFILTKSISRFARNTIDCLELVRKLMDLDVHIYFEKENINTNSMESELMLSILSSLAENESVSLSENSKWSIRQRFKHGTYKLSYPPYGYDYIDEQIVVNEEQAPVIRRIFNSVLKGIGTERIARQLNEEKIPTKRGGNWTGTTIRGIIKNEKYTGDVLLQKTFTDEHFNRKVNQGELDQYLIENHHEAIITHADFKAANQMIEYQASQKNVAVGSRKYLNRYPFSGKIECAECGDTFKRRIHTSTHKKYIAWCCSTHIKNRYECSMLFMREDRIHQAFITMMNKLKFGYSYVLIPLSKQLETSNQDEDYQMITEIEKQLEVTKEELNTLIQLMTKGFLEPVIFNEQKIELSQRHMKLKEEREQLLYLINDSSNQLSEVKRLIKYFKQGIFIDAFDEESFQDIVKKIIVYSPNEIGFHLNCGITLRERIDR